MKKIKLQTASILILLLLSLSSCSIIDFLITGNDSCGCCIEGLLETEPIQDLINGDAMWMDLEVGKTRPEDVLPIFSNMNISYCVSHQSEEVCDSESEEILSRPWGVIKLTLLDFNCEDFWISWEAGIITSVSFRCDDCVTVDSILTEINSTPLYISAIIGGLHETEIVSSFIYPTYGLTIGIKAMDRYQADISTNTTITYIALYPPESELKSSSVYGFITEYDINCALPWVGYGNLYDLYYPEDTGKGCPYLID